MPGPPSRLGWSVPAGSLSGWAARRQASYNPERTLHSVKRLLGRKYQGQGLATEAARALLAYGFDELGMHRIAARTGRDNRRSWYLMERLGMRREAHFRASHRVEGAWRDEFIYALLASEWRGEQGDISGMAASGAMQR